MYKVEYHSFDDFKLKAKRFGIFAEWKDDVPRAGYRGVVTFKMYGGLAEVMMVPARNMHVAKTYRAYMKDAYMKDKAAKQERERKGEHSVPVHTEREGEGERRTETTTTTVRDREREHAERLGDLHYKIEQHF